MRGRWTRWACPRSACSSLRAGDVGRCGRTGDGREGTPLSDPTKQGLATDWLERALLKRTSNFSPVICFETADPRRLIQLKEFVRTHEALRRADNLFLYDP
ncbi:MAG: hypothetical protein IRZ18_08325, partial [Clostridia bacterium]|nr:hypothetical protein [Clostridia bacterium]